MALAEEKGKRDSYLIYLMRSQLNKPPPAAEQKNCGKLDIFTEEVKGGREKEMDSQTTRDIRLGN